MSTYFVNNTSNRPINATNTLNILTIRAATDKPLTVRQVWITFDEAVVETIPGLLQCFHAPTVVQGSGLAAWARKRRTSDPNKSFTAWQGADVISTPAADSMYFNGNLGLFSGLLYLMWPEGLEPVLESPTDHFVMQFTNNFTEQVQAIAGAIVEETGT